MARCGLANLPKLFLSSKHPLGQHWGQAALEEPQRCVTWWHQPSAVGAGLGWDQEAIGDVPQQGQQHAALRNPSQGRWKKTGTGYLPARFPTF